MTQLEGTELERFLRNVKTAATSTSTPTNNFHVVIGNESADLDSFVCAISHAFYLSIKNPRNSNNTLYLPVVAVKSEDLVLRTEIIALLERLDISPSDIVHLDEVDFANLPITEVTLVDHNNKAQHLEHLSHLVRTIVDHHEDSGDFTSHDVTKTIQTVGSCSTLIAEQIFYDKSPQCKDLLSRRPLAELLVSAVLIDTYNLDLHSGRTTELDIFMAEILSQYLTDEDGGVDALFGFLQEAKMDITSMTTYNILRKDYKPVVTTPGNSLRLGISSVTMESDGLVQRFDFVESCEKWSVKMELDVLLVMFLSFSEGSTAPNREICVHGVEKYRDVVCDYLLSNTELKGVEKHRNFPPSVRVFDHNPKMSRKFVLPLLQKMSNAAEK